MVSVQNTIFFVWSIQIPIFFYLSIAKTVLLLLFCAWIYISFLFIYKFPNKLTSPVSLISYRNELFPDATSNAIVNIEYLANLFGILPMYALLLIMFVTS